MVSRPLDFRTIDIRLAMGAYRGSLEAFLDDVQEVCFLWRLVSILFRADAYDLFLVFVIYHIWISCAFKESPCTFVIAWNEFGTIMCLQGISLHFCDSLKWIWYYLLHLPFSMKTRHEVPMAVLQLLSFWLSFSFGHHVMPVYCYYNMCFCKFRTWIAYSGINCYACFSPWAVCFMN